MTVGKMALFGAVAAAALGLIAKPANATFYVFYSLDNGANYTAFPGSPQAESGSVTTISGGPFSIGGLSVTSSIFTTNAPNPGASTPSFTNSTQVNLSSANGGSVRFAIVDNAFQGPSAAPFSLSNSVTSVPNAGTATLTQTSCVVGGAATVTATTVGALCSTAIAITAPATVTTVGSNTTTASIASLPTPFTTVEFFNITLAAGANVLAQGNTTISSVPEPLSLSLLGVGLAGAGLLRRRNAA